MSPVLDIFSRLIGAIACASIALIVWDIGTRSPSRLVMDIAKAAHNPGDLLKGTVRFLIGLVFVAASVALMFFAVPGNEFSRYTLYEIGAFITALAVELLIGEDVRRFVSRAVSRPVSR
ncbi:MAG: hypothetical protein JO233_05150 [Candidatus Eremiobacteraeota bacterium]|nr:hypothetical protein [Candidatus Eremiobacteraeota bacterium]